MLLTGIQQYTMIDYPGKNACVVFTPGCNFRCPFCHNPESVLPERIKAERKDFVPDEAFFKFLEMRKWLLEAVSICWWEPTLQPDLYDFAKKIKNRGFLVKLDTNGRDVEIVKKMIDDNILDYVAIDLKQIPDKYDQATAVKNQQDFWDNYEALLILLKQGVVDYEYRTTTIKWLHTEKDIEAMAQYLAGIKRWYLQTYHDNTTLDPDFDGKSFTSQEMQAFQKIGGQWVEWCGVRE